MSLITLTFGHARSEFSVKPALQITTPQDAIKVVPGSESKVQVKKACQFLGFSDVYVVGQIVSGVVSPNMKGTLDGNTMEIVELESKYGNRAAKEGMTVGLTVRGIPKEAVKEGSILSFVL